MLQVAVSKLPEPSTAFMVKVYVPPGATCTTIVQIAVLRSPWQMSLPYGRGSVTH
jgi:hypothetical protein